MVRKVGRYKRQAAAHTHGRRRMPCHLALLCDSIITGLFTYPLCNWRSVRVGRARKAGRLSDAVSG